MFRFSVPVESVSCTRTPDCAMHPAPVPVPLMFCEAYMPLWSTELLGPDVKK